MIHLKRAYEEVSKEDGTRILVERLWPRGVTKEKAQIDRWVKDLSPSPELRKWFHQDTTQWDEFEKRYVEELRGHEDALKELAKESRKGRVTFVYAAKDEEHNSATILKRVVESLR
ncbi:MAG TPA: DUF488 family protein [Fimbriimonas sp.]|nr:DUF488 family protein [Fimbriimonas sp.]